MIRNVLGAIAIVALSLGLAMADDFKGKVTKVDGSKITVSSKKAGEKQFDVTGAKVFRMNDGNKEEAAAAALKENSNVTVTTDGGGKVTEVVIAGKKKK